MNWLIASNNRNKSADLISCLNFYGLSATNYMSLGRLLQFPEESTDDYRYNAIQKVRYAAANVQAPLIADDSGIQIAALKNHFGVTTARELDQRPDGMSRNEYLLKLMANQTERAATMVTWLAAMSLTGHLFVAEGQISGHIAEQATGKYSGGFDRIFIPTGGDKTLAELPDSIRIPQTHRGIAAKKLIRQIKAAGL